MSAIAVSLLQGSQAWLDERRSTVGSSDIPVIVGDSPYKDARTLMAEKLGLVEPAIDEGTAEIMMIGHLLQDDLLAIYESLTGRHPKARHGLLRHPRHGWATASLDGTAPTKRVVEAKWTHAARWRDAPEGVPVDVNEQVQWQLFVTGWDVADVVVLDGPRPRVIEIRRDQPMIEDLYWFAERFHAMQERGELPSPDGSESARRVLTQMHPRETLPLLPADQEWDELARRLRECKAAAKAAADDQATVENTIRALLGDAAGVEGDGYRITWTKNSDSEVTNWRAVGMLFAGDPNFARNVQACTETKEGPRVLRATWPKERAA